MNTEKIILLDPFDQDQIKLIDDFENENNIKTLTKNCMKEIEEFTKKEYERNKKNSNNFHDTLFIIEKGKVKDMCFIECERDIKVCHISFTNNSKTKSIITYATDYAINSLDMKEIFVRVKENDKQLKNILEKEGYENLGDVGDKDGYLIFLKEKEETMTFNRQI